MQKVSTNSRLEAIYITGQGKGFCWQRIPNSNSVRKETVDVGPCSMWKQ